MARALTISTDQLRDCIEEGRISEALLELPGRAETASDNAN